MKLPQRLQAAKPFVKVRTFPSHGFQADPGCCEVAVGDLLVVLSQGQNAFRGCSGIAFIDLLGCCEARLY